MRFPGRLRPWFLLIAAVPALAVVNFLSSLDFQGAFLLLIYGTWIGEINARLNPRADTPDEDRPWLPWNRLGAGEKLEYLLPTFIIVILGLMAVSGQLIAGGMGHANWLTIAFAIGLIALGAWDLRRRWLRRWAAPEAD